MSAQLHKVFTHFVATEFGVTTFIELPCGEVIPLIRERENSSLCFSFSAENTHFARWVKIDIVHQ
jgi:hypothetical protein